MHRDMRANSIGGDSSIYGGAGIGGNMNMQELGDNSKIDTNKYLRE